MEITAEQTIHIKAHVVLPALMKRYVGNPRITVDSLIEDGNKLMGFLEGPAVPVDEASASRLLVKWCAGLEKTQSNAASYPVTKEDWLTKIRASAIIGEISEEDFNTLTHLINRLFR